MLSRADIDLVPGNDPEAMAEELPSEELARSPLPHRDRCTEAGTVETGSRHVVGLGVERSNAVRD
jgi:hypothetical protein